MELVRDLLEDKKLIIGSLIGIGVIFVVFYIAGFSAQPSDDGLGCFVMLPEEYCETGQWVSYLGYNAVGFTLPEGVAINAPFDGAYFDTSPEGLAPVKMMLGIPGTSSFVVVVANHRPHLRSGTGMTGGEPIAETVVRDEQIIYDATDATLVVYTTNYDINSLFR